ncbi:MAG: hypothetical protein HC881_16820 [Leptolyngbyaceae cyanobacterium SL_7_1]|nr:hypothetical protein [Leptolyngbyaceae cyanobacterium SL_7_1]
MADALQSGWIETIIAVLFVVICVVTQRLLKRWSNPDRAIDLTLDRLTQPTLTKPPKLCYRGAHYPLPTSTPEEQATWDTVPPTPPIPDGVVRLSYRGVPYIQLR